MPRLLLFKKFIARLLFPYPLMMLVGVAALVLAFRQKGSPRQKRIGKWLLIAWMALFYLIGIWGHIPADRMDRRYPRLKADKLDPAKSYTICVFGASYHPSRSLPPECHFNDAFQLRLLEGIRVCRMCEARGIDYRLVASVQTATKTSMETRLEHLLAFTDMFGLPHEKVSLLRDKSYNTRLEMLSLKEEPGTKILVSNGWHLPRINMLARKCGIDDALSAPCALTSGGRPAGKILPNADAFSKFQIYAYEHLGMLEYCFRRFP